MIRASGKTVVELPTLGGSNARAEDINDRKQIVGFSTHAGEAVAEATIWNAQVAGYSEFGTVPGQPGNAKTATFWDAGGAVDIGSVIGLNHSIAYDLNDNGVVALQGDNPNGFGGTAGYAWSLSMGGTPAGADPIYDFGANHGINILNDMVGFAAAGFDGAQAIHTAFHGTGWDIGTEIGPQAVRAPASANAISDTGIIVGQAGDGRRHVFEAAIFALNPRRSVIWLDKLDDFDDSTALDVNDVGLIVGESLQFGNTGVDQRAVVWVDEEIFDLNRLVRPHSNFEQLLSATGVNIHGDIVGYGQLHDGKIRGFVIYGFVHGTRRRGHRR